MSNEGLTVADVINTITKEQKNTLYFYVGLALREKIKRVPKGAAIESFDENQLKVFYYLIGAAMENTVNKDDILEIIEN